MFSKAIIQPAPAKMIPLTEPSLPIDKVVAMKVPTSAPGAAIRSYSIKLTDVGKTLLSAASVETPVATRPPATAVEETTATK